jgi:hypothetical protein
LGFSADFISGFMVEGFCVQQNESSYSYNQGERNPVLILEEPEKSPVNTHKA